MAFFTAALGTRSRFCLLAPLFFAGCATVSGPVRYVPSRPPHVEPLNELPKVSEPFALPLKGAHVLSPFGRRGHRFHTGIDLRAKRGGGDPVLASKAGTVIQAGAMHGYGNLVSLKHGDGYVTRYAHLKSYRVKKGQAVEAGAVLGVVGRTGRATTEHLHFEILDPGGAFIDPAIFLFPNAAR